MALRPSALPSLLAVGLFVLPNMSHAVWMWNSPSGDWFAPGSWTTDGTPGTDNYYIIDNIGTASFSGGSVNALSLIVGEHNAGNIIITGGQMETYQAILGNSSTALGTAAMVSGTWQIGSNLYIGFTGKGSLSLDGGLVTTGSGTYLGYVDWLNASGTLELLGGVLQTQVVWGSADSTLIFDGGTLRAAANNGDFVRAFSPGGITINDGGAFIDDNGFNIGITSALGGTGSLTKRGGGTLTLTADNTYQGGTVISFGTLQVGGGGTTGSLGTGNVNNNGTLAINRSDSLSLGLLVSGSGAFVKQGSGTVTLTAANTYLGGTVIEAGTLVANNTSSLGSGTITFKGGTLGGPGNITLSNAIKVQANAGFNPGSGTFSELILTGNVDLDGAGRTFTFVPGPLTATEFSGVISNDNGGGLTLTRSGTSGASFVYLSGSDANTYTGVTHVGTGVSLILEKNGAVAIAGDLDIQNGSQVTVGKAGQIADTARVNINGTGILQLGSGSRVDETIGSLYGNGTMRLNSGGSSGVLTVTSGSFSGTITGGTTSFSGLTKTGTGTLVLTGSNSYRAQLSLEGGIVSVNSDNAIGAGGISLQGGALLAASSFTTNRIVNLYSGGGTLMAANGETVTFTREFYDLGGGNGLTIGSATHNGTVVLTGTTPHTGATTVAGGTLVANGLFSGTSAVTVQSGATLSGTGTITGNVEIADGGILAAGNSPGTLTIGGLTLNELSKINFELDTPGVVGGGVNDLVAVTGDLTLDGIFNLSSGSLLTSGTYTLLTYGGSLTDNGALFGIAPAGYNFALVTGSNAVNLVVDYDGIQWWDGTRTAPDSDSSPQGGNGTWDNTTENWTNTNANANNAWAGLVARFSGIAGTVSVASDVEVAGLQFETDGYLLTDGGGSLMISGSSAEIFVNPDASAEIDVLLSGTGGVIKNGDGTLVLSHSNSYQGGTTLSRGTLEIASDANLGASTGGITLVDGTLRTTANITSSRSVTLESLGGFDTASGTLTLTAAVSGTGGFVKSGTGTLILNSTLSYQWLTQVSGGTLEFQADTTALSGNLINNSSVIFNQIADSAYSGIVSGTGTLTKNGERLLDLTGATLTHSGFTTVNAGTLAADSLSSSALDLAGGAFSPGGTGAAQSITVRGLSLNGGSFVFDIGINGISDLITVTDGAAALNSETLFTFNDLGSASGTFHLLSGLAPGWNLSLLSFDGITPVAGNFVLNTAGTDLYFSLYEGGLVTGTVLQNSGPVGTPITAEFFVTGPVETGTPAENNTVNSLTFEDESSLLVLNNLTVTSGSFAVVDGTAALTGTTGSRITTPGDFNQTGSGKLISDIAFEVGGTANIQSGYLVVNGTLSASGGVVIAPDAVLGGNGIIDGNLVNHGTVSPGNSPGTITVLGDYAQTGNFLMEIAGNKDFDRLIAGGRATLEGSLIVIPYDGYQLEYGRKFTFLKAAEISGAFDETILPGGFRGRILIDDEDATLLVAPESYTQVAVTPNQKKVAKALNRYISATGGDREAVSIALDELKADEYPNAFNQIAPTFHETLANITVEQSNAQGQMLQQRFSAEDLTSRGFSQSGLEMPIVAEASGKTYSGKDLKEVRNIMEPVASNPWSVWVQGNGLFAKNANISNVPNYRFDSGGFLLGAAYRWSDCFATGLYAGYQGTRARYDGGGRTDIDAARFGGYATYNAGNGFYANALAGGGHSRYDLRRSIKFGSIDRTARSTPSGGEFSAMLGSGYDWRAGDFVFGPVASAQYTYVAIDSFTETGAKSLDLRLDDQDVHSLRGTLGARLAYTWQPTPGVAIIPELRATWQHEFLQDSRTLSAALDGGSGPGFNYVTSAPQRDALFVGAGVNFLFGNRWSANAYYNADCASGDFKSQMVSGGVSVKF